MTTAEILKELQESMRTLLSQNQEMSQKIEKLETENQVMKRKSEDTDLRIKGNLEKLEKLNADAQELIEELLATRNALEIDGYLSVSKKSSGFYGRKLWKTEQRQGNCRRKGRSEDRT